MISTFSSGSGASAIHNSDLFMRRLDLVKVYAVSEKHRIQVLYGLQCAVTKLFYSPILCTVAWGKRFWAAVFFALVITLVAKIEVTQVIGHLRTTLRQPII